MGMHGTVSAGPRWWRQLQLYSPF